MRKMTGRKSAHHLADHWGGAPSNPMNGGCPLTPGNGVVVGSCCTMKRFWISPLSIPFRTTAPMARVAEIEWGEIIILPDKVVLLRQWVVQINGHRRAVYGSRSQHGFGEDRDDRSVIHTSIKCDSLNEEAAAGIDRGDLRGRDLHGKQSPRRNVSDPEGVAVAEVIDVDRIRRHDVDAGREVQSGQNLHRKLLSQPNFAGVLPAPIVKLLIEILLA